MKPMVSLCLWLIEIFSNDKFDNNKISYIHICWYNFDALAQGKACKPTKEPVNYCRPSGDRTHDFQTEATPPAASCPAHSLPATEIVSAKLHHKLLY